MQNYTDVKRLSQSRDNWKKRASVYQSEKRSMTFKLRDIQKSRDYWKSEYYAIIEQYTELKKKYQRVKESVKLILEY